MAITRSFPTRGSLRRPRVSPADVIVGAGMVAVLFAVIRLGHSMDARTLSAHVSGQVSTSVTDLPYYAARSLLRMFIALFLPVIFTFIYATAAARMRRARVVLIPLLDILQSVPILGFLTITITFFIALFPGSILGLECASIFSIFTSQAWNMTFSMYHSLITQPSELDEAARRGLGPRQCGRSVSASRRRRARLIMILWEIDGLTSRSDWNSRAPMT